MMKVYIINSSEEKDRVKFAVSLAQRLKKKGKTLLISTQRQEVNIEDFFGKDGMITYDLADYFLDRIAFEDVLVKDEGLDFIIGPLLEDKYEIKKEDMDKLISQEGYDFLVIDKIDPDLVSEKKSVLLVEEGKFPTNIKEDSFFIREVSSSYDIRLHKEKIEAFGKNFLGEVKATEGFDGVVDNLINENYQIVPNLSFFEKLKMKFSK